MRFTTEQYDAAILALSDGKRQLEPDGRDCEVCGDSGHMAFECGHNPLVAVAVCRDIANHSEQLHTTLHRLAGYDISFGVQIGPAKVVMPGPDDEGEGCWGA